jgi:hypothetical protein
MEVIVKADLHYYGIRAMFCGWRLWRVSNRRSKQTQTGFSPINSLDFNLPSYPYAFRDGKPQDLPTNYSPATIVYYSSNSFLLTPDTSVKYERVGSWGYLIHLLFKHISDVPYHLFIVKCLEVTLAVRGVTEVCTIVAMYHSRGRRRVLRVPRLRMKCLSDGTGATIGLLSK